MEQKFFSKPSTFVGHVELKVENIERSVQFYKEVIGFKVLEQSENKAILSADGKTKLLTVEQPEDVSTKEQNTTGLYHFAILLPDRISLARVIKHFIQLGTRLGASDHLVSEALYLNDPDGNGIEIYRDRPSSEWTWNDEQVTMTVDPLDDEGILAELNGTDDEWTGLPSDTVMGHIHLHVSELQKTKTFYCEGLGFDIVCRFGNQALFISTGGYHHHIGLNTWAGVGAPAPSENSVGLDSFTLVFPDEDARNNTVRQLEQLGFDVYEKDGIFVTKDPSSNTIQLVIGE